MEKLYPIHNSCYFNDIESKIIEQLRLAKDSIDICLAWINVSRFNVLLLEKIHAGVKIRVLCNKSYSNVIQNDLKTGPLSEFVRFVKNPIGKSLMHHKFCIIDDQVVITGSYNWSNSAVFHYENIVVIQNDFQLINKFKHEFEELFFMASLPESNFKLSTSLLSFNLGMISSVHGKSQSTTLSVWNINYRSKISTKIHDLDIPYFHVFTENEIDKSDFYDDKEYYQEKFRSERDYIETLQLYFKDHSSPVHVIGRATIENGNAVIEYREEPEKAISLYWIDMRFTKLIPSTLEVEGELENVWDESYHAGM